MDELFGEANCVGVITWESKTKSQNTGTAKDLLQRKIEYLLIYKYTDEKLRFNIEEKEKRSYPECDDVGHFRYKKLEEMSATSSRGRASMVFPVLGIAPREGKQWKEGQATVNMFLARNDIELVDNYPFLKIRPFDEDGSTHYPFWSHFFDKDTYGTAESGLTELKKLFPEGLPVPFETVKPTKLISKLLFHIKNKNALILDPFAGSASTFHAMLQANMSDEGNRKAILIEAEEYSSTLTQERMKRVIDGVPSAKDAQLRQGLGGSFTAVTLGEPINLETLALATDETLPSRENLGRFVFYNTTLQALATLPTENATGYLGETATHKVYLLYKPERQALTGTTCAFTLELAERIARELAGTGKEAIVYAPISFVDAKTLKAKKWAIRYCNLPYELLQLNPVKPAPEGLV
jgi:hypothetical protein